MKFEGLSKLRSKLQRAGRSVESRIEQARKEAAEDLLERSIAVTPMETGTLRASGFVEHDEDSSTVGFGGPAAPYAVYPHEMVEGHLNWTTPGTGAKYLERPYLENRDRYAADIKDAAKGALD